MGTKTEDLELPSSVVAGDGSAGQEGAPALHFGGGRSNNRKGSVPPSASETSTGEAAPWGDDSNQGRGKRARPTGKDDVAMLDPVDRTTATAPTTRATTTAAGMASTGPRAKVAIKAEHEE